MNRNLAAIIALLGLVLSACLGTSLADEPRAPDKETAREDPGIEAGHNLLRDADRSTDVQPGRRIGALSFRDVTGRAHYLRDCLERGPAAFVFMSTKCPLAKRYTERLKRIHQSYSEKGLSLFAVFPNSDETDEGVTAYVGEVGYPFPVVRDADGYLTDRFGATMTPQAFLVDRESALRYRGAIDDNRFETRVKRSFLVEAVEAVLEGGTPPDPVPALGCTIYRPENPVDGTVTYSGQIARILQDNCQNCHRDGQVAPFTLNDYRDAVRWKTEIKAYTEARLMPPWKAVPGFGEFKNDVSLTEEQIRLIGRWVEQGAAEGDPKDLPPQPKFNDGWAYGEPDLVIEMPDEYVIGPEGEDDYRHFIVPYENDEHRFVEAVDVKPGNRNVVHHVLAYVDTSGKARELDAADPGPGYTRFGDVGFQPVSVIGGWAPGNRPEKSPPGTGRWLPKKSDIVLQVHYYRTGVEERDRTKLGIYFSKNPRPVPIRSDVAINTKFVLPAGAERHEVRAECEIDEASYLFAVTPHMHLLGETMTVTAHLPDGEEFPVVKIDDWDFNWQITYLTQRMKLLPAGTKVKLVATFDNSAGNPNNPNDPPKDVGWGEKTTDEMCIAFLALLRQSEYDPEKRARREQPAEPSRDESRQQARAPSDSPGVQNQ